MIGNIDLAFSIFIRANLIRNNERVCSFFGNRLVKIIKRKMSPLNLILYWNRYNFSNRKLETWKFKTLETFSRHCY